MERKTKLMLMAIVGIVLMVGAVIGSMISQKSVTNNAGVSLVGQISLWADSACTVPVTNFEWGQTWAANQTMSKLVYVRNDANAIAYLGWEATGFTGLDAGTGFYWMGVSYATCDWYFFEKESGTQWRTGLAYLKTMAKGAVLNTTLSLSTGYNPTAGAISFTVTYTAYSTPSG